MNVNKVTVPEIHHGHKLAGTTRAQLTTLRFAALKGVLLKCPRTNTKPVYVGGSGVTANTNAETGGMPIEPGEAMTLPIDTPASVYVVSEIESQDVAFILL